MCISRRAAVLLPLFLFLSACSGATAVEGDAEHEAEAIARTEFTERVENFFEYEPLHPGKPSPFRIHLTDLSDGSPVSQADVTLSVRRTGSGAAPVQTTAKVGKVTGIYVAELTIPEPGDYDIEFHIKNAALDERLLLTGFKVEQQ